MTAVRRCFVAGATGYTGRALVALLCNGGVDVCAHIRPGSSSGDALARDFEALGARVVRIPWEPEAIGEELAAHPPTHVFGLLGTTAAKARAAAKRGDPPADYDAVDIGLTRLLYDAAAALPEPPTFVYLSALGADGGLRNAYMEARYQVEQTLRNGPLPWISVRPSFITGSDRAERRPSEAAGAVVIDAGLSLIGAVGGRRLADRFRSIDAEGLASVLADLAFDPGAVNRAWEPDAYRAR